MTKKYNRGSENQNSPRKGNANAASTEGIQSGDNSKGNKRNKDQNDKTDVD
ncbi:hypothetical protein SM124_10525 [Bacillus sp. 31A1R]|uniref:Imidazoleglycerol-phosphate dehydratase n=1 Tax=Robertmurraya mangrovi TaxID=3098077 RepID=A0ABU5IYD9_9BACI|nr:hypothetical protein [Bacillus sp. 31A1R]MDZ5472183.1 hypothetical protein [Bacillus sp. 31A1R]